MPFNLPAPAASALQQGIDDYYKIVQSVFTALENLFTAGDNLIYANILGTPQQVAALIGTNAAALVQWQALLSQIIVQVTGVPPVSNSVNFQVTLNPDGSLTIVGQAKQQGP